MSRVNIWMKEEVHKRLKIMAALKGQSIQDYVEEAVKSSVNNDLKLLKELI